MAWNREKNASFFPSKVFRCPCLMQVIDYCFENGIFSFTDIYDKVHNYVVADSDIEKVFSIKCGKQNKNCMFVCEKHVKIITCAKKKYSCTEKPRFNNTTVIYNSTAGKSHSETFCTGCIKRYLRLSTKYFYYKKFDLKKKKKWLVWKNTKDLETFKPLIKMI